MNLFDLAKWEKAPAGTVGTVARQYGSVFPPLLKLDDGRYVVDESVGPDGVSWKVVHPVKGVPDQEILRVFRSTSFGIDLCNHVDRIQSRLDGVPA